MCSAHSRGAEVVVDETHQKFWKFPFILFAFLKFVPEVFFEGDCIFYSQFGAHHSAPNLLEEVVIEFDTVVFEV